MGVRVPCACTCLAPLRGMAAPPPSPSLRQCAPVARIPCACFCTTVWYGLPLSSPPGGSSAHLPLLAPPPPPPTPLHAQATCGLQETRAGMATPPLLPSRRPCAPPAQLGWASSMTPYRLCRTGAGCVKRTGCVPRGTAVLARHSSGATRAASVRKAPACARLAQLAPTARSLQAPTPLCASPAPLVRTAAPRVPLGWRRALCVALARIVPPSGPPPSPRA